MRQIVQRLSGGPISLAEVPAPVATPGHVVIANEASVISSGTERMVLDLARKSLLAKARERPDQVRRVLQKVREEGLLATWKQVKQRLEEPATLGYASAGVVLATGAGVESLRPGDRVASNGPHAEVVSVPEHLCARVPERVGSEDAAFAVLGAIALQGVRLAELEVGSTALVVGLGLLGQLTVQLLVASGCRVVGADPDPGRCALAARLGALHAEPGLDEAGVLARTRGRGADAVLVTAATSSRQPMDLAIAAVRKKGRVVLVGVAGMELDRRPWFYKEAELVVSCSYGPGRYDPAYEEGGRDYPAAYVRWTEQRNLEAVLDLMASGRLDPSPLVTHRFPIERADEAYRLVEPGGAPHLAIVLQHPGAGTGPPARTLSLRAAARPGSAGAVGVGVLGAGSFARSTLLPALRSTPGVRLRTLASAGGLSAADAGRRLGFEVATSDEAEVLADPAVDAVLVLTRHDLHADQAVAALQAGKHVFVEKPLALTTDQVARIGEALGSDAAQGRILTVGFNRRFAEATRRVREHFAGVAEPLAVHVRFNAGTIPAEHWTQDAEVGGGRIVGEACHAIDLAAALCGAPPVRVFAEAVGGPDAPQVRDDRCFLTLRHANGSVSSVAYLAGGDRALPKERVEVFGGGRAAVIDDWRHVELVADGRRRRIRLAGKDKGHAAELAAFVETVRKGGEAPIPWAEIEAVSLASILAVRSLREGVPLAVGGPGETP